MPSALPVRFPQLRSRSARTDPRAMARKLPDLSRFNSEGGREWSARVGRRATSRKTMTQPQPSRPAPAAGPEPVSFIIRWGEMVGAAGIEPATPAMSTQCSPTELRARPAAGAEPQNEALDPATGRGGLSRIRKRRSTPQSGAVNQPNKLWAAGRDKPDPMH